MKPGDDPGAPARRAARVRELLGGVDAARREDLVAQILNAIAAGPDPDRALVQLRRFAEALVEAGEGIASIAPAGLDCAIRIFAFSPFLGELLIRFPAWATWLGAETDLAESRDESTLESELTAAMEAAGDDARARRLAAMRRARRELLRLGARRILDLSDEMEMTRELSALAAATLRAALGEVEPPLAARFGQPREEGGEGTLGGERAARFCVIAMGKLGGGELNFSSDIDLMFVYSEEGETTGQTDGTGRIDNHKYYARLAEALIGYVAEASEEGFFYRVDARLRPDGDSGPLARSLTSCEIYYTTQAHPWERLALLKARWIAGDRRLGEQFEEMVRPLVFNPLHGDLLTAHIAELKRRIDVEVTRRQTDDREIKRGTGGIREIEFLVQTLQMLHGARYPELGVAGTLDAIATLARHGLLPEAQAWRMREDYVLLRTIEHRLQMMELRQTHLLPTDAGELDRLALRCGIGSGGKLRPGAALMERWKTISRRVHADFVAMFEADEAAEAKTETDPVARAAAAVLSDEPETRVLPLLEPLGLAGVGILKTLRRMGGLGTDHYLTQAGRESFRRLLPMLLRDLATTPRPPAALAHLDSLLTAVGAFSSHFELFAQAPETLALLLETFGSSDDAAQTLIAHPEFIDYLREPQRMSGPPDRATMAERLERRLQSAIEPGAGRVAMARFKRFEYLMTVLGETAGLLDYPTACARMSETAELVVGAALRRACESMRRAAETTGFAVLSMGKLGARELDYHSDLDLIFVWDESFGGAGAESPVEAATALAEKMVEQLTTATPEGRPYEVDARLRPEGQNAPLAPPFGRYEEYFAGRAQPWEFQSAMQLRPIAGDAALGERLRRALGGIVARRVAEIDLKKEIRAMRRRIEENLKPPRWAFCDFKKGIGGLLDPAFVAQYLQLRHLAGDPALIGLGPHAAMNRLVARGKVEQTFGERFATGYIWLRRIERRTRRLLGSDRSVIPNGGERLEALERACRSLLGPGENLRDRMALELRNNRAMYGEVLGE